MSGCLHKWHHAPDVRPPRAVLNLGLGDERMRWQGVLLCSSCGALWPGTTMPEAIPPSARAMQRRSIVAARNARHRALA